jgi:hypothetical protein
MRAFFLLAIALANENFEYFRCDACHATFYQLNARLQTMKELRSPLTLSITEWVSLFDEVCDSDDFSKRSYGVKQYEGKNYLFGPGVPDHLGPDKGFGQMGMGDYDLRLAGYCRHFVELVGEDEVADLFHSSQVLDPEALCAKECTRRDSGMVPSRPNATKPSRKPPKPTPPATPERVVPKEEPKKPSGSELSEISERLRRLDANGLRRVGQEVLELLSDRAMGRAEL